MWTFEARCSFCQHKAICEDRKRLLPVLAKETAVLSSEEPFTSSPGDGIIIMNCQDFARE